MKYRLPGKKSLLALLTLVAVATFQFLENDPAQRSLSSTNQPTTEQSNDSQANWLAGEWITVDGTVKRSLPDDNEGSRHQRFILALADGRTLLVAHNIDLAQRVPVKSGDRVSLRGRYESNTRGGVVHWTHHDPDRRRSGGWIEFNGKRYR